MSDIQRKYLPSIAELVDRLSIDQLKEVFLAEHKDNFKNEMSDIEHDIQLAIDEGNFKLTPRLIRAIIVIAQINAHIWYNESAARKGEDQDLNKLRLTHGLNGIRQRVKNILLDELCIIKGKDFKTDCLAAEFKDWEISLK
jgi:hypothetical protein